MKNCTTLFLTSSVLVISLISFTGCSYDNISVNADLEIDEYDVYVYGLLNGENVYWLNGEVHSLQFTHTYISDAAAVDGDFYLAGYSGFRPNSTAKYWKNGVEVNLGTGGANGIAISGSNIYVAGWEGYDGAKYWKNNHPFILDGGSQGNLVAVSGSDFYITGYLEIPSSHRTLVYAELWKNGVSVDLGPHGLLEIEHINAITISGVDVYLVGFEDYHNWSIAEPTQAKYWKNGSFTYLDGTQALDIIVKGDDVYIVGFRKGKACLWKNNIPKELAVQPQLNVIDTFANPYVRNRLLSITTYGDDILIKAGSILLKNDTIMSPFDGSDPSIDLTYGGVVVAKRKH
jgi:hypothetical protein